MDDEAPAIVFDVGNYTIRAGYAGDDRPKVDMPTVVGVVEDMEANSTQKIFLLDATKMLSPPKGTELVSFLKDGMIEDWDMFENVVDYVCKNCIHSDLHHNPVVMTECSWNERESREKLTELMFEKYNVPAFFLGKNAVLSAYANARTTGIVIDSGSVQTSAIPIQDGTVLSQAIVHSPLAGDFISAQCTRHLEEHDIEIIPQHLIARRKDAVKANDSPKYTAKGDVPDVAISWHNCMVKQVTDKFRSILEVSETPVAETHHFPTKRFEFPNGFAKDFGSERFLIPESLFDVGSVKGKPDCARDMSDIVTASVAMCDSDIRSSLYTSVIVTGGNTMIKGFSERLARDISAKIPHNMKLKVVSSNNLMDRKFASWIGGSIIASLEVFPQLCISRQEYDEVGKAQVGRKCP